MKRVAACVLLAAWFAGCSMDGDRGLLLTVVNRTEQPLTIRFEGPDRDRDVGVVAPGQTLVDRDLFLELLGCAGPFVAFDAAGQVVVRRDEVCPNVTWTIDGP